MDKTNMFSLALSRLYDEAYKLSPIDRLTIMTRMYFDEPVKIAGMEMTRNTMAWVYYLIYPEEIPDVLKQFVEDIRVKLDDIKQSLNGETSVMGEDRND